MRGVGLVWLVSGLLCGCGSRPGQEGAAGVVSLVPSVTEVIYALGAGDQLLGNTVQCDFPEAAKTVYKVGDFLSPDVERIAALRPRFVFLALPTHRLLADKLIELGVRTYASNPRDIEAILAEIESIGRVLGREGRARSLVDSLSQELAKLPVFPDTPRVYLEISSVPLTTAGAGTFLDEVVRTAGGRNVYGGVAQEYPLVDVETVLSLDPEVVVILCPEVSAGEVSRRLGWERIAAVRSGRIFDRLDADLLVRPGPRIVQGILELARLIHSSSWIRDTTAG